MRFSHCSNLMENGKRQIETNNRANISVLIINVLEYQERLQAHFLIV